MTMIKLIVGACIGWAIGDLLRRGFLDWWRGVICFELTLGEALCWSGRLKCAP